MIIYHIHLLKIMSLKFHLIFFKCKESTDGVVSDPNSPTINFKSDVTNIFLKITFKALLNPLTFKGTLKVFIKKETQVYEKFDLYCDVIHTLQTCVVSFFVDISI